jgi:hypothetical protein
MGEGLSKEKVTIIDEQLNKVNNENQDSIVLGKQPVI